MRPGKPSEPKYRLLAWILLLQALDAATTILAVNAGATELNPLIKPLLKTPWLLLTAKLALGWVLSLLLERLKIVELPIIVSLLYIHAIVVNVYNYYRQNFR